MSRQRRVLITGAGSGLGQALALRYARSGARIACVDLTVERSDVTRAQLSGSGHLALAADVGSDDAMIALQAFIGREWGGLDVLINNAGIAAGGTMVETTMAEWQQVLNIDLLSVVRGCRLFLPGMLAAGSGQIISCSYPASANAASPAARHWNRSRRGSVVTSSGA